MYKRKGNMYYSKKELQEIANNAKTQAVADGTRTIANSGGRTGNGSSGSSASGTNTAAARNKIDAALKIEAPGTPDAGAQKKQKAKDFNSYISGLDKRTKVKMNAGIREGLSAKKKVSSDAGSQAAGKSTKSLGAAIGTAGSFKAPENRKPEKLEISPSLVTGLAGTLKDGKRPAATAGQQSGGEKKQDQAGIRKTMEEGWTSYVRGATDAKTKEQDERIRKLTTGEGIDLGSWMGTRTQEVKEIFGAKTANETINQIAEGRKTGRFDSDEFSDYGLKSYGWLDSTKKKYEAQLADSKQKQAELSEILKKKTDPATNMERVQKLLELRTSPEIENERKIINGSGYTAEQKENASRQLQEYNAVAEQTAAQFATFYNDYVRGGHTDYTWDDIRQMAYDSVNGDGAYDDAAAAMSPEEKAELDAKIDAALAQNEADEYADVGREYNTALSRQRYAEGQIRTINSQFTHNLKGDTYMIGAEAGAGITSLTGTGADDEYHEENDQWQEPSGKPKLTGNPNVTRGYDPATEHNMRLSKADQIYHKANNPDGRNITEDVLGRAYLMTDEERETFNRLYNGGNKRQAEAFYDGLSMALNERMHWYSDLAIQEKARRMPISSAIAAREATVLQPFEFVGGKIAHITGDKNADDPYSPLYALTRAKGLTDQQISGDLGGVGGFFYNAMMSGLDSYINLQMTAALGIPQGSKWFQGASLALFGTQAYQTSLVRGLEETKGNYMSASIYAYLDAAIETATEIWSLEALMGDPTNMLAYLAKVAAAEGSEEFMGSAFGPYAKDLMYSFLERHFNNMALHRNEWTERADNILAMGGYFKDGQWVEVDNADDAMRQALREWNHDILISTASGAVSTFGSGMHGVKQNIQNRYEMKKMGRNAKNFGQSYQQNGPRAENLDELAEGQQQEEQEQQEGQPADGEQQNAGLEELLSQADRMAEETESAKVAALIRERQEKGQEVSDSLAGKLVRNLMVESEESEAIERKNELKRTLRQRLLDSGEMNTAEANRKADLLMKQVNNEELTKAEQQELDSSKTVKQLDNELRQAYKEGRMTEWQAEMEGRLRESTKGMREIQQTAYKVGVLSNESTQKQIKAQQKALGEQLASREDIEQAEGQRAGTAQDVIVDGRWGTVKRMVTAEETVDGEKKTVWKYEVDVGGKTRTVEATEIKAADFTAASIIREQALNPGMYSAGFTNKLLDLQNRGTVKNVGRFLSEAQAVRIAAFTGTTMPTTSLDNSTALEIYNDSLKEAQENRTAEVRQTQAGKRTQRIMFKGAEFGTEAYKEAIKDLDRNTVREMEAVAGVAQRIGIDVTFRTPDELKAYGFQTGDTVELNIGARNLMNIAGGGRQNMMVTFGHELTHWLQEHSMAGYNSLRNFVFSEMQKNGVNIQRRVGEIMANRQGQGINLTLSQAVSEIVANACDQILTDGAVQQRLEEVKPKLAAQVKNFVKDLMGKIRRASTGMSESRSADARNFYLSANELAKKWIGAYDEAINNIVTEAEMPTAEEVKNFSTEEINAEYMDAVRDNNKPLMRRILDEAARRAGYTEKAFHGSDNFGFTQFDLKKGEGTIFVAYGRRVASTYVENNELKDIADMDFRNLSQDRLMELVRMVDEGTGGQMTDIRYNDETNTYEVTLNEEGETVTEDYTRDELVDMLNGYLQNVRETRVRDRSRTDSKISSGIYRLYVRPGRELHVDAAGAKWNKITVPWSNETMTTREIAEYARVNGFDSVRIDNVIDNGKNKEWGHSEDAGSIGIFFNETDVKSADLVTRDNNGKIIKPGERFNDSTKDLRYSVEEVNRKIRENDFTEQETKDAARILQNAVRYPVKNFKMAEPVEMRTDGMMAIHNLSVENLLAMLKLGGIASPSIALIARNRHWTGYGPVSIFFGRTSVDPMISSNRLYNGDAYTPTMGNANVQTAEEALEILRSKQNRDLSQAYLEDAGGTTRLFRDFKRIASMSEARAKAYAYETEDAYERSKQYHKAQDMERNIFRAMRESLRKHTGTGFKFGQSSSVSEAILMAAEELQQREEQGDLSRQEKHQIIQLNLEEACRKNRQSVLSFEQDPGIYDQILEYIDVARTLESGVGMMESKPDRIIGVNEWMAVQLPASTDPAVIDALVKAGIDGSSIYTYDTLADMNSRANQQREIALKEGGVNFSTEEDRLNRYRSNILGQHERIVQYYENEWDNLLKKAGISQADARALTMNEDGSLNTDGMSEKGAEAARKLKKSQLKRLQMFDRQIRKWSNTKDAVMGLTMDDLGMQYEEASEQNDKAKMDELLLDKASRTEGLIPYRAPQLYDTDRHRWVANAIKEGNAEAIKEASFEMAQLVPQNAVLIPMAPHTGKVTANTDTMLLAREISRLTGRPVINAMEGAEREKRKETKLKPRNKQALAEDLGFRQVQEIPEGTIPIFIDNMIGSGETAKAAHMAFGHGVTLAYAKSTRAAIDGLKNVGQTWIDKEKHFLVPYDAKYDMSVTGFKGTNFSVEETDDYYEQARKNNDVAGMMGIIAAAAERAMPDSKIRDERGMLIPIYHGTEEDFTVFDPTVNGGKNGKAEGFGIYLTDNPEISSHYGTRTIAGYVNMKRPAYGNRLTINRGELARVIQATCEQEARQMMEDDGGDDYRDYLKDTWISNYIYTPEYSSMNAAYRAAASQILKYNENDMDVVQEIMTGMGIRDYGRAMAFYHNILTPVTGIDGYWQQWSNREEGTYANVFLAFDSSQIKSSDAVTYDDAGKPIKPSERFDMTKKDIRWSVEEDGSRVLMNENGEPMIGIIPGGTVVNYSYGTYTEEERQRVYKELIEAGFSKKKVENWIRNVNTVAAIIAADRTRLDFIASEDDFLKFNAEYVKTLDASTLCAKRLLYQGTFNKIQKMLPNTALRPGDLIDLVNMMHEMGYQTPCGICYVESRRRNLGSYVEEFLKNYNGPYIPKVAELTTTDGLAKLKKEHREAYDAFIKAMNKKGTNNPKVVSLRTEYRGDIMKISDGDIRKILAIGGLRIQSFSDFETVHMLDMMQAIMDMSTRKLTSQAYTKVPGFAAVFGDTGIKINLSLIAEGSGLNEKGELIFSSTEGMDFDDAMKLREKHSKNVGTILVGVNDEHIIAAMGDKRIDFIIPFHQSGWSREEMNRIGTLKGYKDYTFWQNERMIMQRKHVQRRFKSQASMENWLGRQRRWMTSYEVKGDGSFLSVDAYGYTSESFKKEKERIDRENKEKGSEEKYRERANYNPVGEGGYWNWNLSGRQNAELYLQKCAEEGRLPKFWQFLVDNGDGSFSLPQGEDKRSTAIREGYWKTLIDFKMYDNEGKAAPQEAVKPIFDMDEAKRILAEYDGNPNELKSADDVAERYVEEYKKNHPNQKNFSVEEMSDAERVRYAISEDGMDVMNWMAGLTDSGLMTEGERIMLQAYKDLRMKLQVCLQRQRDYTAKIKKLEARESSLTFDEREELRKLKNNLETQQLKQDRLEDELYKVTDSEGYAGTMYRQNKLLNDFIYGRTQEQVDQTVRDMMKEIGTVKTELEKRRDELKKLGEDKAVRTIREQMSKTSLSKAAAMLRKTYGSTMNKGEIEGRLAEMALKLSAGEDIMPEAEALAEDLAQKIRGEKSEALEALRGTTLVIGRETLRQIKEEQGRDSSLNTDNKVLKIIRDKLRGSGIKVAVERNDMFDAQWEDLRENNKAMPDLNEIAGQSEKLNVIADWVAQQMEASRGINQAQVDMAEMAALIYANVSNIGVDIVTDPVAKKQLARINAEVQEMARKVSGQADAMAALEEKMNSLILAGTKARGWTSVLNRDVKAALDYYSKTAKLAAQTERQKVRTVVVEQLKSEHTRKLVQQRLKYEAEIAENRKSQQLYLDNESLRKKTNTVVKRLRKLLTAETDKENIPEEAKPLARMLCSLIVNHDMVFRKVSYGDKKQLEDFAMRLRKMDAADGPFDADRDLSWLIVGSGEDVDTEMRDRAMQDLADIEDGLLKYRMAEGKRNITLQDRKEALQKIQRAASEIYSMIQARRGAFVQGQRVMVKDLATQMEEEMKKSRFKGEWKGNIGRMIGWSTRELNYGNLTPEYFFMNLKNSVMNLLHGEFHEAENRFGLEAWKSAARVKQIAEECGYANWDTNKKIGMKLDSGRELYMTLGQVMSLYATWKREQQQLRPEETSHLLHGGFVLVETDNEKGAKRERSRQRPIRINEFDAAQLGDLLTEEQRQYVDRIVEYMSTDLAELGNEASMKMYGIRKYTEKYYFPIKSWGGVLNSRSDAGVNSQSENRSGHQGFTKRIRANAANAIEIGDFTQTAVKHIVGMMTYNSIAPAVENMNRVLNQQLRYTEGSTEEDGYNRNMRAAFQEYYGKAAYDYLVTFMQDINGSNGVSKGQGTLVDKLLGVMKKNAVAGSMSVALQQPMSYIRAAMMINPKYMTKALAVLHGKNNSYFERMKYSGVSVIKEMGRFEMNSGKSAIDYIMPEQKESGARAAWNKVTDNMTILPEKMDAWTWNRMWVAVKLEQMDAHPDMDHESDAFMKIVAERFNDLMRKTQVYDSALVKSQNMRDTKSWVRKTMTNFMAEPTLTLNVLADAFRNIKEPGGKANAAKAVALFLLSAAGQAGIKATLGAGRSPDKDKTQWENWLYKFWYNLISEVNVANLVPGYRDIVDVFTNGELKDDEWSILGKARDVFKNVVSLFDGKDNKNWYRALEDSVGQFMQISTNAPLKNMMRDFRAMINFFSGGRAQALTGGSYADRASSAAVMKYQFIDTLMNTDLVGAVNATLKYAGLDHYGTGNADYYKRIYESLNSGNQQAADEMKEYLIQGKGLSESGVNTKIREQTRKDENLSESDKIQRMGEYGASGDSQGDYITDQYKAGKLSREDAERMFSEANPDKDADSIWWTFDRIDYKKETGAEKVSGNYYRLHDAIENNKSDEIQGTVKLLMEHGMTKKNIKDNITDTYRPKYLAAEGNEKIRMKDSLIKAYKAVGLTAEEAEKLINKWKPSKKKDGGGSGGAPEGWDERDSTGQWGEGNIDLNHRKVVRNRDGSISTERSFSFYDEDTGKEILIPQVVNGKIVTEGQAIDHYYRTGEYLGMFDTPEEANEYAEQLHNRQDWYYNR